VLISVTNTVAGVPSKPGHGIGIASVRERLRLMHDLDADFRAAGDLDAWQRDGVAAARAAGARARLSASEPRTMYSTSNSSLVPNQGLATGFSDSRTQSETPAASNRVSMP